MDELVCRKRSLIPDESWTYETRELTRHIMSSTQGTSSHPPTLWALMRQMTVAEVRVIPRRTHKGDVVVAHCATLYWICFFKKFLNRFSVLMSCQTGEWHVLPMRIPHCHQEETSTHHSPADPSLVPCAAFQGTFCHNADFQKGLDKNWHKLDELPIDFWCTMNSSNNIKWMTVGWNQSTWRKQSSAVLHPGGKTRDFFHEKPTVLLLIINSPGYS